jgi:acetoin utilization deacetylase AcuC-like enzyme
MVIYYSPRCLDYAAPGHPERPARIRETVARLRSQNHDWREPIACTDEQLLRVHHPRHLDAVRHGHYTDADTPHFPQMDELARLASGAAVQAAQTALSGARAFSLMRPPGHHAERNRVMGFCYFNHIAVAVADLLATRGLERVSILDFDCHHGNGTEDIFRDEPRVRFVSLHQSPCYPGSGLVSHGNCFNFPLPPGTGPGEFLESLGSALETALAFDPQALAVSAGFDMFHQDPITDMALEVGTFADIGRAIGRWPGPIFAVLEGGYAAELPDCIAAFLSGWESAR